MLLPSKIRPAWEKLLVAFPELVETTSPVAKLAGSAFAQWYQLPERSTRIALRPTPEALEIWAGEIEDASTCLLARAEDAEATEGLLARALGTAHPLSNTFVIRFIAPDAESCWPARPLMQGSIPLAALSQTVQTLDLYPQGLGATLSWEAATPETVHAAIEACAEFVQAVSSPTKQLGPFLEAQTIFDASEDGPEASEDGSMPPLAGYRARMTREFLSTFPPLALKWIAGIGFVCAFISACAALGRLLPRWGRTSSTDSPLFTTLFAVLFTWAAFAAYRSLQHHRHAGKPLPWTKDHPWPARGPLFEDWRRDLGIRLWIALPCLFLGTLIMTPEALEESDAACFNVGLGVIAVLAGAFHLLRAVALVGRILLRGPARLWLEPYPPHPGAAFTFLVHVPGRGGLPVLNATLRGYRPHMVESGDSYQVMPLKLFLRSVALEGPIAEPGGRGFRGGFSIPETAPPSAHSACPGIFWELTVHGPKARRHPDLCFLIPVYGVGTGDMDRDGSA